MVLFSQEYLLHRMFIVQQRTINGLLVFKKTIKYIFFNSLPGTYTYSKTYLLRSLAEPDDDEFSLRNDLKEERKGLWKLENAITLTKQKTPKPTILWYIVIIYKNVEQATFIYKESAVFKLKSLKLIYILNRILVYPSSLYTIF